MGFHTYLEQIELEDGLTREVKAAGEKIEACSEEGPYGAEGAEWERRSDIVIAARVRGADESEEQDEECQARDGDRKLYGGMVWSAGLCKGEKAEGMHECEPGDDDVMSLARNL